MLLFASCVSERRAAQADSVFGLSCRRGMGKFTGLGLLGACILVAMAEASHGQDDSLARKMATAIAKTTAVNFFSQWEFELDESGLKGKIKAIEPEEHVKVEVKELRLFDDSVALTAIVDARYGGKGKAKAGDKKVSIKADGDVAHEMSIRANFHQEGDKLVIDPKIQRLKLEIKRLEVEPSDLDDVEERLKAVIKRNEARFLKDLNDWITKNRGKIKSE